MSVLTLEAKLERVDPSTPWGFRMQGGKDFHSPLSIQRVNAGSLAAKCGLQQGDIILKIGSVETEVLRHKEAQDSILHSGNKLDLLLQRIRDKRGINKLIGRNLDKYVDTKGSTPTQTYVSTPPVGAYNLQGSGPTSPASTATSSPGSQNYNQSARPFGNTSNKPSYGMDNVTQKTSQMSFSPKPVAVDYQSAGQKYAERDEKPPSTSMQSKSFRFLKDTLDSGQESPTSGPQPPWKRAVQNARRRSDENDTSDQSGADSEIDEQGKKIYRPSETFKLVHEAESGEKKIEDDYKPNHSRTFKFLQQQLNNGSSDVQQSAPPSAPKAPPPPSAPKAPPASKPGVWTPGQSQGGHATAPKPFSPTVQPSPPAPGGPRGGAAPKPTGVGAVRAKKGEASMFMSGDAAPGGQRTPVCNSCGMNISEQKRGPFVVALGKTWCPDHFVCANPRCGTKLLDIGFVEEGGFLYCEKDYELYFAPKCAVCGSAIVGECVNALQKTYHPKCFTCVQCKQQIGGNQFHLEDGKPYCENDWRQLFQTMCHSCNFPIEPGDNWVEAMGKNYHSGCFNCSTCQIGLEGQPFFAKAGKPYCKTHAR
ncbi:PDZ and LIM domain protein 7-like isoform X20 [Mytilus edulis]|uniref:PDZ and LIM domain protein 7-like isoform X20 n=1 Tax=Mytilus edulis TaxID=6550 RepID=UPI0039F1328A